MYGLATGSTGSFTVFVLKQIFPLLLLFPLALPAPTCNLKSSTCNIVTSGISFSSDPFRPLPSLASRSCLHTKADFWQQNFVVVVVGQPGQTKLLDNLDRPKSLETGPGLGASSSSSLVSDVNGLVELIVSGVNGLPELIQLEELILLTRELGISFLLVSGEGYEGPDAGGGHILCQIGSAAHTRWLLPVSTCATLDQLGETSVLLQLTCTV